jgi:hypothetical protein
VVKKLKTKVLRGWTDYPLCKNYDGISLHTQRNRLPTTNGHFPEGEILKLYRIYLKYLSSKRN